MPRHPQKRRASGADPAKPFTVAMTYDTVTPESAENGEASDSGWEYTDTAMSLRELLHKVESMGAIESSRSGPWGESISLCELDGSINYSTGEDTRRTLHVHGSANAMRRFRDALGARDTQFARFRGTKPRGA